MCRHTTQENIQLHATDKGYTRINHQAYIRSPVNVARCTSGRPDGPSSSATKNTKDISDLSNLKNQRLPNTVLIMITSDYKTLSFSLQKPATWIVSSEKPLKLRCIQITSTEMGDSASTFPGSLCCITSRKETATSITQRCHPHSTHLYHPPSHYLLCIQPPRPVRSLSSLLTLPFPLSQPLPV